jgi:hypothetical protein
MGGGDKYKRRVRAAVVSLSNGVCPQIPTVLRVRREAHLCCLAADFDFGEFALIVSSNKSHKYHPPAPTSWDRRQVHEQPRG